MSIRLATEVEVTATPMPASVADFLDLLKLRVMSLVVFTAAVGMLMAPGGMHPGLALIALFAIAVGAGAAGVINMWYDADIDALMSRTCGRPIPSGRVTADEAIAFGGFLALGSVVLLFLTAGWLPAALLAFTILFYGIVYTVILKRRTPQNIVIGGAAGALPPVIGWAVVTGSVSLEPIVLFLIIFLWTPAHFWALALLKKDDYARAGVPMLPVVAGDAATRRQIVVYTILTVAAGLAPAVLGYAGPGYAIAALALGGLFLRATWRMVRAARRDPSGLRRASGALFGFSIVYLFALFTALAIDHVLMRVLA